MSISSPFSRCLSPVILQQSRSLFYWINLQFNALDIDRIKKLGPDRTCAEWILRNGGSVKFMNFTEYSSDYNELPPEETIVKLKEVDASHTNIMHCGFEHFKGCKYIDTLIFHKCFYVNDEALVSLHYLKSSLKKLKVSCCPSVTDKGVSSLAGLKHLSSLNLCELQSVQKLDETIEKLKSSLPNCKLDCT
ncbi:ATP synthase subunit s, mitochondrial isoform X1 [Diorhabda carinulata]|uniref:ATP synthase subunit s, mitochondrial isoform X1 n=1 Tax=Diorhabda carinulata TaxID=1163345 RepID=UPI0025A13A45|nr:ATP synthase subunit s, mitochondrial isoform X1 [Diorhabda carinulata]